MHKTKEKITHRKAFEDMFRVESKSDFYELSYNNIPLWIYPRERSSNFLNGLANFPEQATAFIKIKPFKIIVRIINFFINLNKIFGNDVIVFTNERHLQFSDEDNGYYNQYAELVLEKSEYKKALIFEFPTATTKKYKKVKYERYLLLDFVIALKMIFSFLSVLFYPKIKRKLISKLKKADLWQLDDIKKIFKFTAYQAYSIEFYGFFLKIVKFLNPKAKLIYSCMGAYDKFLGIIEIQHGMIDDTHLQYIFPNTPSIKKYLGVKKTIVFSDRIKKMLIEHGYLDKHIEIAPNPKIYFYFLKNIEEAFLKEELDKKEIVIIGGWGGSVQEKIKNVIFNIESNKEKFEDWTVSLVLHPSEKNVYKDLGFTKVKIYENHEVSLWEMLSRSVCMVAVYSTVLEEATFFGCFEIIIENEELEDQKRGVEWLCKNYPYRANVLSDNFFKWFEDNKQVIINHREIKNNIMKKNYDYFKNYKNR